jgi:urocanate hydratase
MDLRHKDFSHYTADMSVHNFVGDAVRGADWVALHNGGGTGWGQAINGGFGLVLDGSTSAQTRATRMLFWDVVNGLTRRAWSGNENALYTVRRILKRYPAPSLVLNPAAHTQIAESTLHLTLPNLCDPRLLDSLFK